MIPYGQTYVYSIQDIYIYIYIYTHRPIYVYVCVYMGIFPSQTNLLRVLFFGASVCFPFRSCFVGARHSKASGASRKIPDQVLEGMRGYHLSRYVVAIDYTHIYIYTCMYMADFAGALLLLLLLLLLLKILKGPSAFMADVFDTTKIFRTLM